MPNRHLLRTIAMQSLYEWDFRGQKPGSMEEIIKRDCGQFAPGADNFDFSEILVKGVIKNQTEIPHYNRWKELTIKYFGVALLLEVKEP